MILQVSAKFCKFLQDSTRFCKMLQDSARFFKIQQRTLRNPQSKLTSFCWWQIVKFLKWLQQQYNNTTTTTNELRIEMTTSSSKNVILWCISCYCSSKKEKTGGGHKSYNCSFWAPSNFLDFWASPSWCTSKEHIFYVELGFWQKEINLRLKKLKKVTF